jgi:hypothetical protein
MSRNRSRRAPCKHSYFNLPRTGSSAILRNLIWRFTCLFVDGERTVYAKRHSISRRVIERCSSSRAIRAHAVREPGGQHAVAVCECALSRELSRLESEKYFVECSAKF